MLVGFMAALAVSGAALGALWAERVWGRPDGHSVWVPTKTSAGSNRVLWTMGPDLPSLEERVRSLQREAQILFLPAGEWAPEGVRRMESARPSVEAVLDAAAALSLFGPVRVVVEGADALEAPGRRETGTAVLESLLTQATTGVAVVLHEGDARPEGPWDCNPAS